MSEGIDESDAAALIEGGKAAEGIQLQLGNALGKEKGKGKPKGRGKGKVFRDVSDNARRIRRIHGRKPGDKVTTGELNQLRSAIGSPA